MNITTIISDHVAYNLWANERMVTWLKTLDRSLLSKETPSSFPSIDLTMQHMIHAQNFWFAVLTGGDIMQLDEKIKVNAVETVMNDLLSGAQRMIDIYGAYSDEDLLEKVRTPDDTQSRFGFILHVVNHASYHRGQIVTMARSLGVTAGIPVSDYDAFLWWKSQKT